LLLQKGDNVKKFREEVRLLPILAGTRYRVVLVTIIHGCILSYFNRWSKFLCKRTPSWLWNRGDAIYNGSDRNSVVIWLCQFCTIKSAEYNISRLQDAQKIPLLVPSYQSRSYFTFIGSNEFDINLHH